MSIVSASSTVTSENSPKLNKLPENLHTLAHH